MADGRRPLLRQAKLRAVVAGRWGLDGDTGALPGGASLGPGGDGRAWILVDEPDRRALGAAVAWASAHQVRALDLIVETDADPDLAGLLAWRAGHLAGPPGVWALRGRDVAPAAPAAPPPEDDVPPGAWEAARPLDDLGVTLVAEHGSLLAEVLGLEVARVGPAGDGWRIEVGVGAQDRSALAALRPGEDPLVGARRAAQAVAARRRPGVARHPANTLARERWLRAALVADPGLVGAAWLAPVSPALRRPDLRAPSPAPAVGEDPGGRPLVVVASTGIDTDLVPSAAHARAVHRPGARLVIAVPVGDDHHVTRRLAAALAAPAEVVAVPPGWEAVAGADPPAA